MKSMNSFSKIIPITLLGAMLLVVGSADAAPSNESMLDDQQRLVGTVSIGRALQGDNVETGQPELQWLKDLETKEHQLMQTSTVMPAQSIATIAARDNTNQVVTREQVLARYAALKASNQVTSLQGVKTQDAQAQYANPVYHQFEIYEAYSRLFKDDDYDGFHQTFSVTFDADVFGAEINPYAAVYAELYLSRDGGPWEHYATTDVFGISGDSTQDDYEMLTTLQSGYPTDYYDVLIDLYEVGYSDIVATISADDVDGLYGLPLESRDRDPQYVEVVEVVEVHGGSMGLLCLGLLMMFWMSRQFRQFGRIDN